MTKIAPTLRDLVTEEDTVLIKSEPKGSMNLSEPPRNDEKGSSHNLSRKRRRRSTAQYVNLDSEDDTVEQLVKKEKHDNSQESGKGKTSTRVKKSIIGRYQDTCRRYKKELSALPSPKLVPREDLSASYEKSIELASFMKEEYDERHAELVILRTIRTQLNAKVSTQKKALAEAKESRQRAEIKAEVFEKSSQDANMQLTLKVARPLSRAQIKLENVHEDYAAELAQLRTQIAQNHAETKSIDEARIRAETALAELRVQHHSGATQRTNEVTDVSKELEAAQKLLEDTESSMAQLTTTNIELKERLQVVEVTLEGRINELAIARAEFVSERDIFLEANEKLKAQNEELEQRVLKQKAVLDSVMKAL